LAGREGLTAASTVQIAQYAPKTPKITVKIAVLPIKKTTKIAFTLRALAGSHPVKHAAAKI
jgi:hypothetical protein